MREASGTTTHVDDAPPLNRRTKSDSTALFALHVEMGCEGCADCLESTQKPEEIQYRGRILTANQIARQVRRDMARYQNVCTYCGDIADHADHLVPLTWSGPGLRSIVGTVPSCADCNTRISDFPISEIVSRCDVVRASLERSHSKLLRRPPAGNLEGVTGTLLKNAMARRFKRASLVARLAVLRSGGFLCLTSTTRERIVHHGVADLAEERFDSCSVS